MRVGADADILAFCSFPKEHRRPSGQQPPLPPGGRRRGCGRHRREDGSRLRPSDDFASDEVGGESGGGGVRSVCEPNRTSRPYVLVRPADRAAGDRGDARRGTRTRLVWQLRHDDWVPPSRVEDPGTTPVRSAMVSLCWTGGVLAFGRGNLVRRPPADPVSRGPLPDRTGDRIPARESSGRPAGRPRTGDRGWC